MPSSKGITAVVAIVLLLMMTVGAAGMAYIFTAGLQTKTQESASGGVRSLQEATSSCISVDSVYGNKVYLKNCGSGVITGDSLLVYMDGKPINSTMSPAVISKGEVGTLNLSGIWDLSYDKHTLKIGNGVAQVMQRVVAEPRKDDAAGIWRFDEGSGTTAYDGSGNNNIGTLLPLGSEPVWTSGKFNKGLQFDGVNDYVDAGNGASLTPAELTVQVWAKNTLTTITTYDQLILSKYTSSYSAKGYSLTWGWGDDFYWRAGDGTTRNLVSIRLPRGNNWYYLVGSFKNGEQKLYVNGELKGSNNLVFNIVYDPSDLYIGDNPNGYRLQGIIDEVRIYNKALTPDELVNLRAA